MLHGDPRLYYILGLRACSTPHVAAVAWTRMHPGGGSSSPPDGYGVTIIASQPVARITTSTTTKK